MLEKESQNKGLAKMAEPLLIAGQKIWRRSDGAILWSCSNLIIRLEFPVGRQYEAQLKSAKEQKERASVPSF